MARTRWECPNGCAALLGPQRPGADHVCRFCLACSAKGERMVRRIPGAKLRAKARKAEARKRQEARITAQLRDAKRARRQRAAVDYSVVINGSDVTGDEIRTISTFDNLPDARRARLAARRLLLKRQHDPERVVLTRLQYGVLRTAVFHGARLTGWALEDGGTIPHIHGLRSHP